MYSFFPPLTSIRHASLAQQGSFSFFLSLTCFSITNLHQICSFNPVTLPQHFSKMTVDFRRKHTVHTPPTIHGNTLESVESTRFLWVHIADDLTWTTHTTSLVTIESILTSSLTIWYSSCTASDQKSLQRVVRTAERIIRTSCPPAQDLYPSRYRSRATKMICSFNPVTLPQHFSKMTDFRRQHTVHTPLTIHGNTLESVESTRFLWVHIADDLTWTTHTTSLVTIESILTSSLTIWYSSCTASDQKSLQRVVRTAERIIRTSCPPAQDLYPSRYRSRATKMICSFNPVTFPQHFSKMTVDFRRKHTVHTPLTIHGNTLESVESTRFLGVHIADDLTWTTHTTSLVTIESILTSSLTIWYSSCTASDQKSLQRVVRTAERIIRTSCPPAQDLYPSRYRSRANKMGMMLLIHATNGGTELSISSLTSYRLPLKGDPASKQKSEAKNFVGSFLSDIDAFVNRFLEGTHDPTEKVRKETHNQSSEKPKERFVPRPEWKIHLTPIASEKRQRQDSRKQLIHDLCSSNSSLDFPGKNRTFDDIPNKELEHLIVDEQHGIIYCYVPKVASTNWKRLMIVLSESLLADGVPYQNPLDIPVELIHRSSLKCTFNKFLKRYGKYSHDLMKIKLKKYTKFLFVRDPFVRLISAYRNKFEQKNEHFYKKFAVIMLKKYGNYSDPPASVVDAFAADVTGSACNIIQHDWFGGGSVMVWGGISLEGGTDLYRLDNGTLAAIRYQDEILGPVVRPYAGAVGPGFFLVHNNARPHVARVCRRFLENEGIDTIDWPTGSPDLNPIEHLWDIMFRSIRRHQVALQTVQELSDALVQIWEEIPQDTIRQCFYNYIILVEMDWNV
ncbi:hypothetical protein NFI96_003366 [Prochilodus magdalenae]|nr:hypothetical protein NFI96_003366 [Prochilodus magdalenae]